MSHVHSKGIRLSFGEGTCYLSPTKMFSGLIEKEFESLGGKKTRQVASNTQDPNANPGK